VARPPRDQTLDKDQTDLFFLALVALQAVLNTEILGLLISSREGPIELLLRPGGGREVAQALAKADWNALKRQAEEVYP